MGRHGGCGWAAEGTRRCGRDTFLRLSTGIRDGLAGGPAASPLLIHHVIMSFKNTTLAVDMSKPEIRYLFFLRLQGAKSSFSGGYLVKTDDLAIPKVEV